MNPILRSQTSGMGSRNAVEIYDPALARQQQMLAEPHKYAGGRPTGEYKPIQLSADVQQKIAAALAKETEKLRVREEERRKRDPTYNPNAIELSGKILEFDKYVDYYELLGVDCFASSKEIKDAYKKMSLELHPDKQKDKPAEEQAKAKERFLEMVHAHTILSDLATRRAYDTQRDHLSANNEAGLQDVGKIEKPPPTCVDVMVTLEQLYRGTRKQVDFERNEFANTRWAKKTYDTFFVKINRGELEGATIWHRSQGDVGPFGRCDLVFVVKQEQHPVFERLGDDLWYYDRTPVKATKLFYVGWAPTLGATKSCTKHERYNGQYRRVAAVGSMLYALLGFDRSGIGEALVAGHGMPLRPTNEREELEGIASERDKGDLVVKFPIELPRGVNGHAASAPRLHLAVGGPLPMPPIVLLMPEEASGRPSASALRVLLVNSVLPAILQWVHRQRFMCQAASGGVSPAYPPPLLGDEDEPWLQGKLPLSALPPVRARPFGPTELIGVCLLVGGPPAEACPMASSTAGVAGPSDASWALMAALSHSLPALQWRVIHMAGCVSEPLLADEELLVESACLLLLDALPDVEPAADVPSIVGCIGEGDGADGSTSDTIQSSVSSTDPDVADPDVAEAIAHAPETRREAWADEVKAWAAASEWTVSYSPGMFVRCRPDTESGITGCMRHGEKFTGKLVPGRPTTCDCWIEMAGSESSGPRYVLCAASQVAAPFVRPWAERSSAMPASSSSAMGIEARPWQIDWQEDDATPAAGAAAEQRMPDAADETAEVKLEVTRRDRDEQAIAEAEQAEDASWEADVAGGRDAAVDEAYLEAGCASAAALMRHPTARCVLRCHCEGGVVLAVGRACSLLSHAGRRRYRADDALDADGPVATLTLAELEEIREVAMADDIPIQLGKMCTWSRSQAVAYFENNGVLPASFNSRPPATAETEIRRAPSEALRASGGERAGLFLPYLIGCTPAARSPADCDGFRRLRAATVRAKLDECKHGFSAIGLPAGAVLTVLTANRYAVRSVLGSAQPHKFALKRLQEVATRRDVRIARRKVDTAREAKLEAIWSGLLASNLGEAAVRAQREAIREAHERGYEYDVVTSSLRGACTLCGCCACFVAPQTPPDNFWSHGCALGHCAGCGCSSSAHEELNEKKIPGSRLYINRASIR